MDLKRGGPRQKSSPRASEPKPAAVAVACINSPCCDQLVHLSHGCLEGCAQDLNSVGPSKNTDAACLRGAVPPTGSGMHGQCCQGPHPSSIFWSFMQGFPKSASLLALEIGTRAGQDDADRHLAVIQIMSPVRHLPVSVCALLLAICASSTEVQAQT